MSRPVAPRGPRQAPGPRSGAGARRPGSRHPPRHASAPGYAAREIREPSVAEAPEPAAALAVQAPQRRRLRDRGRPLAGAAARPARRAGEWWAERRARFAEARAARSAERAARREEVAEPAAPGELTGLRLLLDQLDALLRDPTLALALRRFTDKVKAGLRLPSLRWPAWLRLPHLPRWLLLPLLALLLGLGSIALLSSGDDRRDASGPASGEIALPGVGMPALEAAPDDPPAARIALVVDDTYAPAALRRELQTLGFWLDANHAPGTRVTIIDAASGRASAAVRAADLATAVPSGPGSSASAAVGEAFRGDGGRRLLVGVGAAAPASGATTLAVATRPGAPAPANVPVRRGGRSRVAIDDRRPGALAASIARALIAISNQRER